MPRPPASVAAAAAAEVDLASLRESLHAAKCVVLNNPSNPCGSVWSRQHCAEAAAPAPRPRFSPSLPRRHTVLLSHGPFFP